MPAPSQMAGGGPLSNFFPGYIERTTQDAEARLIGRPSARRPYRSLTVCGALPAGGACGGGLGQPGFLTD